MGFPPVPPEVKPVAHLMKLAEEHDVRNVVVAYWARMAAVRLALMIVPGRKTPETTALLGEILNWLEITKKENKDTEGIGSETAAQAIIEEYALNLFEFADKQDHAGIFNKNTIKTFYTAGMLFDVLEQFVLSEDLREKQRYAKWKAAYIHNCLKSGQTPIPGPLKKDSENITNESPEDEQLRLEQRKKILEEEKRKLKQEGKLIDLDDDPNPSDDSNLPVNPSRQSYIPDPSPTSPGIPTAPGYVSPSTPQPTENPKNYLINDDNKANSKITPDVIQQAQKYSKFATSALNYDDVASAITNLQKALNLLQTGKE